MKTSAPFFALFLSALVFSGCESINPHPLDISAMTPNDASMVFKSTGKTLALGKFNGPHVKGGELSALNNSLYLITTFDLRKVVAQSLKHSRLFSSVEVEPISKVDYVLTASILGQPDKGLFNHTSSLIVKYEIIRKATGELVFSKTITGKCTVTVGHAPGGVTRARLSVQGAVRDNMSQLLEAISQLKL